jgi:hypothetical protein
VLVSAPESPLVQMLLVLPVLRHLLEFSLPVLLHLRLALLLHVLPALLMGLVRFVLLLN